MSAPLPRSVALAGPPINGLIGVLLLGSFFTLGDQWDLHTRELVCFAGWLNVAALGNLLPAPGADGAHVWGRAWDPRPRALAYIPGLAFVAILAVGGTSMLVPDGAVRATFSRLETWIFVVLWTMAVAALAKRLLIPDPTGGSEGLTEAWDPNPCKQSPTMRPVGAKR